MEISDFELWLLSVCVREDYHLRGRAWQAAVSQPCDKEGFDGGKDGIWAPIYALISLWGGNMSFWRGTDLIKAGFQEISATTEQERAIPPGLFPILMTSSFRESLGIGS